MELARAGSASRGNITAKAVMSSVITAMMILVTANCQLWHPTWIAREVEFYILEDTPQHLSNTRLDSTKMQRIRDQGHSMQMRLRNADGLHVVNSTDLIVQFTTFHKSFALEIGFVMSNRTGRLRPCRPGKRESQHPRSACCTWNSTVRSFKVQNTIGILCDSNGGGARAVTLFAPPLGVWRPRNLKHHGSSRPRPGVGDGRQ
jgi:hypothetical protein